jgi:predicted 3-demethylubiquinone-9 3-methyltransferase (glyoxalase superfamily)
MTIMQKITPCLWFDGQAEEAANFYCSIFKNSQILETSYYGEGAPKPAGTVLLVSFELDGQEFQGLNGGPEFQFTEALSLSVSCDGQDEVDYFWDRLTDGGEAGPCGWLKDKYGVSWQIVPQQMGALLGDPDPGRASRAMQAMMGQSKIILADIQKAADSA